MKCNLKISSNSKLWEAKAAAQDHTKGSHKKKYSKHSHSPLSKTTHLYLRGFHVSEMHLYRLCGLCGDFHEKKKKDCQIRLLQWALTESLPPSSLSFPDDQRTGCLAVRKDGRGDGDTKQGECGKPHSGESPSLSKSPPTKLCAVQMRIYIPIRESHKQTECNSCIGTRTATEYLSQSLKNIINRGGALCTCVDGGGKQQAVMCYQYLKPLQQKRLKNTDTLEWLSSFTANMISHLPFTAVTMTNDTTHGPLRGKNNIISRSKVQFSLSPGFQTVQHYTYIL